MPSTSWSKLTPMQLGQYGENFAKMVFSSFGYNVHEPVKDRRAHKFIAENRAGILYEIQVKSVRNDSYAFIQKNRIALDDRHLICFIRFTDGQLPDCYVIPATVFKEPDGSLFTSRDYQGLKSQPEYGISVAKKNQDMLKNYEVDLILAELL